MPARCTKDLALLFLPSRTLHSAAVPKLWTTHSLASPRGQRQRAKCLALLVLSGAVVGPALAQPPAPLDPFDGGRVTFYIETPPTDEHSRPGDEELALWALESWQRALGGALTFVRSADEDSALVRVHWAPAAGGQYGEMRALDVDGRRGAAVFIRPDMDALGDEIAARAKLDALFRDTIVYLTCLHELGHALGLVHTDDFADVMYFFGFGGDIGEYFGRYRRLLRERIDIRSASGLSAGDLRQLEDLYGAVTGRARTQARAN